MRHRLSHRQTYLYGVYLLSLLLIDTPILKAQNSELRGLPDSLSIRFRSDTLRLLPADSSKLLKLLPHLETNPLPRSLTPSQPLFLQGIQPTSLPRGVEEAFRVRPLGEKSLGAMPTKLFDQGISHHRYTNEHLEAKLLGLGIELSPKAQLETSLTLGHLRPMDSPNPRQMYELYAGLALRPSETTNLRIGIGWRDEGLYRTLNPHASAHISLNARLSLMVMGGASLFNSPINNNWQGMQLYAGARLQYQLNRSLYLYGYGRGTYTQHFPSAGNVPWASQWAPQLGGGVGLNIDGSGPIELGVVYRYNVMTRRMEPSAEVNLFGAFNLLIKAIRGLFGAD